MVRLARSVATDAVELRGGLLDARDSIARTHNTARAGVAELRQAAEAIEVLSVAFGRVCRLVERGASEGQHLAGRAQGHIEILREGLRQAHGPTASG